MEALDCFYFKMLFFCHIKKIKMFKDELGFFFKFDSKYITNLFHTYTDSAAAFAATHPHTAYCSLTFSRVALIFLSRNSQSGPRLCLHMSSCYTECVFPADRHAGLLLMENECFTETNKQTNIWASPTGAWFSELRTEVLLA